MGLGNLCFYNSPEDSIINSPKRDVSNAQEGDILGIPQDRICSEKGGKRNDERKLTGNRCHTLF